MSKWLRLSFALALVLVVMPAAGCLKGPAGLTETQFKELVTLSDIQQLSTPSNIPFTSNFYNYKSDPSIDPAQTLHMNSYYGIVFNSETPSAALAVILVDYDSAQAMQESPLSAAAAAQLTPMTQPIASGSREKEFNAQGLGSVIVFQKGNTLVEIATGLPEGTVPFMSLSSLETLARHIAAKI